MNISSKINAACDTERRKNIEWKERMAQQRREHSETQEKASSIMYPSLTKVDGLMYAEWLKGYLENGGNISHVYDYPMRDVYVATDDIEIVPLYGASSISIVVTGKAKVSAPNGLGHINIYVMEDFKVMGCGFVPLYSDVKSALN